MAVKPERISVSYFRANLPMILTRVSFLNESFIIMKHGKPYAVVRPSNGGGGSKTSDVPTEAPVKSAV